jgi:hypothetical protein
MKSMKESISAAAMLALTLAVVRLASPIAGPHRLGATSTPSLAGGVTPATATSSAFADDGSGGDDDGDEDGGDGSSGY